MSDSERAAHTEYTVDRVATEMRDMATHADVAALANNQRWLVDELRTNSQVSTEARDLIRAMKKEIAELRALILKALSQGNEGRDEKMVEQGPTQPREEEEKEEESSEEDSE